MAQTFEQSYDALLKEIRSVAKYKHRYDVFRDFVTMSAIALSNAIRKDQGREDEYLKIIKSYEKADQMAFPKLLGLLTEALEFAPFDVLGKLFMDLELGSRDKGQFFTPATISEMMAQILHGEELENLTKPFITLSEPACGAGGMVLAFVKTMISHGHDPAKRLWVQCIDVDRLAALMCYVQLALWNVPAEVLVGNTLSLQFREVWHTPQHLLGMWEHRLANREAHRAAGTPADSPPEVTAPRTPPGIETPVSGAPTKPVQFDFGF